MSWRTNPIILKMRGLGRFLGINKLIASYILGEGYETRYEDSFFSNLRLNDCIWDVGANIGHYTKLFSKQVGDSGRVFSFEPSPINFVNLKESSKLLKNTILFNFGLGDKKEKLCFQQGADDIGATSRIVDSDVGGVDVDVLVGLDLINEGIAIEPNAIKIDVEGFEYEVLRGLGNYLNNPKLRLIGVEIHFEILKDRGIEGAPVLIENMLVESGFIVEWTDPSHIVATRNN
jgi:FkbM family methyltransferase